MLNHHPACRPGAQVALGNVMASNAVNVYVGLGLPWLIGALVCAWALGIPHLSPNNVMRALAHAQVADQAMLIVQDLVDFAAYASSIMLSCLRLLLLVWGIVFGVLLA